MSQRGWLISGALLLILGAFVGWWLHTFKRVPVEISLPPRGEARYNTLFALKKTLQAQKIEVISYGGLNLAGMNLKPGDMLVMSADVRNLTYTQVEKLMNWVAEGGHLIFGLPQSKDGRAGELLDYLGLSVAEHWSCIYWGAHPSENFEEMIKRIFKEGFFKRGSDSPDYSPSYCSDYRFRILANDNPELYEDDFKENLFDWLWGSEENGYIFGRERWGKGSVFIAADLGFLTNDELKYSSNKDLTWQVLAPVVGKGRAHLVYAVDVPAWYVLLVYYGWPILLPLLFALLAWLWMRSQRFGPIMPLALPNRRALLEHIQASGDYAFRRGRVHALYAAIWRSFESRMRRRDPSLAALDGEVLVQALSARYQVSASSLRQALSPVELHRPDNFLRVIKTLMQLRARL